MKNEAGNLVITRKLNQKIVINQGQVIVEVIQIKGNAVRLKFIADKNIPIQREELVAKVSQL